MWEVKLLQKMEDGETSPQTVVLDFGYFGRVFSGTPEILQV